MAKKGQKFNKYDSTLKYEICKKHFEEGFYNKKGRAKEDEIDYKARYEILKKYQAFLFSI